MKNLLAAALFAFVLTGCTSLGNLVYPETTAQKIVAADEAAAGLINTAALFEKNGTIKPHSTTETVIASTIKVIQGALDKASDAVASGDDSTAKVLLSSAQGSISGLTDALNQIKPGASK